MEEATMDPKLSNQTDETRLDQATARRLARLRTMPVDTRGFDNRLATLLPPPPSSSSVARTGRLRLGWLRPLRALAASLLILGLIAALLISTSGGPALASV